MNMLGLKRKYSRLWKNHKAQRSNRAEHGRLFLEAKNCAGSGAYGRHHDLQCRRGGVRQIALACQHRPQFGQNLGRE
jgi:hypothetical protein